MLGRAGMLLGTASKPKYEFLAVEPTPGVDLGLKSSMDTSGEYLGPPRNAIYPSAGYWQSAVPANVTPQWITFDWILPVTIQSVILEQYSANYANDVMVEYWSGSAWVAWYALDTTPDWLTPHLRFNINNEITTTRLRITITYSVNSGNSLFRRVQVIGTGGSDCVVDASHTMYAYVDNLVRTGTTITASGQAYGAAVNVKDGTNADWETDTTPPTPIWLEIAWASMKIINYIELISHYGTNYKGNGYKVSYWNGTAWVVITNFIRNCVSTRITPNSPIGTSKLRFESVDPKTVWWVESEIQAFGIDGPGTPVLNMPTNVQATTFDLGWSAVSGATGYYLDVATTSDFQAGTFVGAYENFSVATTSTTVTVPSTANTYYCRVRAHDASYSGLNSNINGINMKYKNLRLYVTSINGGPRVCVNEMSVAQTIGGAREVPDSSANDATYSGGTLAANLYDLNDNTVWQGADGLPRWASFHWNTEKTIKEVKIKVYDVYPSYMPNTFQLQGSTDGINWNTLGSYSGITWSANETKTFTL
jgi:hypothetical protein